LAITLAACGTLPQCQTMPKAPTRPVVKIERTGQGGFCVNSHDDAVKMGKYIFDLERGYK
jgi:hypothetical protein